MKCLFKVIFKKKYIYLLGTPLLILVFGTYQSFYMMYITLAIIYYLDNYDDKSKFCEQLKIILSYVLVLVIYGILTIVTGNIINSILNVEKTGYLTSQMNWFNGNFIKGILYCGYYFVSVLFGFGMDNNLGYLVLIIIILINFKKEGKERNNIYNLALIMLLFSPFLISVLFGTITFSRAQFSIPIIMAYLKKIDKRVEYEEVMENYNQIIKEYSLSLEPLTEKDFRNIDYFFNKYDLIISNPPFYKEKTLGGDNARDAARHNSFLPFDTLVANAVELLESNGIFSVIIPYGETGHFISICASHKLYLKRRMDVRSSEKKAFKRTLLEFSKTASSTLTTALTLNAFDGSRTKEYTQLTKDFYL